MSADIEKKSGEESKERHLDNLVEGNRVLGCIRGANDMLTLLIENNLLTDKEKATNLFLEYVAGQKEKKPDDSKPKVENS